MRLDLHTHSTASDGSVPPARLVELAKLAGLDAIALTDHDSVSGVADATAHARQFGVRVIPGVELSAVHDGHDVHILGYMIDIDDAALLERLTLLRDARLERARSIVAALRSAGFDLAIDDVLRLADGGAVGRSHVARALVGSGHATDVADAFERFIGRDRPFYVAKPVETPERVISSIREAGGVAVLAHPGITDVDELIPQLVDAGLAGLEALHAEHTTEMRERYTRLAHTHDLVVTGGSDFHGPHTPSAQLGVVDLPPDTLDRLARRIPGA